MTSRYRSGTASCSNRCWSARAASLVNLIIHAVLLAVVLDRSRFGEEDTFVPHFVQYTLVIVATGTLLMAGHFVEVMVWAITYGLVGVGTA